MHDFFANQINLKVLLHFGSQSSYLFRNICFDARFHGWGGVFLSVSFDDAASCKDYVASMTEERVAWGTDGKTRGKPLLVPLWQPPVTH